MTDITKCRGRNCGMRRLCLRYTAPASDHQSWAAFDAEAHELLGCDDYVENDEVPIDRVEEDGA